MIGDVMAVLKSESFMGFTVHFSQLLKLKTGCNIWQKNKL